MKAQKRIAIYGGTFDPVHRGHLEVARKTTELFGISELRFMPARQAPHKLGRTAMSPLHRFAMLALATESDANLLISTFELDAPETGYTIRTLDHFRSEHGEDVELFFVMGADSWRDITTWREWQRLVKTVNHIVVTRPGYDLDRTLLEQGAEVVDVRGWTSARIGSLLSDRGPRVYLTDAAMVDVSATSIREAARTDQFEKLRALVPGAVASYIIKYQLYKNSNEN